MSECSAPVNPLGEAIEREHSFAHRNRSAKEANAQGPNSARGVGNPLDLGKVNGAAFPSPPGAAPELRQSRIVHVGGLNWGCRRHGNVSIKWRNGNPIDLAEALTTFGTLNSSFGKVIVSAAVGWKVTWNMYSYRFQFGQGSAGVLKRSEDPLLGERCSPITGLDSGQFEVRGGNHGCRWTLCIFRFLFKNENLSALQHAIPRIQPIIASCISHRVRISNGNFHSLINTKPRPHISTTGARRRWSLTANISPLTESSVLSAFRRMTAVWETSRADSLHGCFSGKRIVLILQ